MDETERAARRLCMEDLLQLPRLWRPGELNLKVGREWHNYRHDEARTAATPSGSGLTELGWALANWVGGHPHPPAHNPAD
jgi:hypothetical protein